MCIGDLEFFGWYCVCSTTCFVFSVLRLGNVGYCFIGTICLYKSRDFSWVDGDVKFLTFLWRDV